MKRRFHSIKMAKWGPSLVMNHSKAGCSKTCCHSSKVRKSAKKSGCLFVSVYLCQETTGATLREIAEVFNLGHYRSASYITHEVRVRKKHDLDLSNQLLEIMKMLL